MHIAHKDNQKGCNNTILVCISGVICISGQPHSTKNTPWQRSPLAGGGGTFAGMRKQSAHNAPQKDVPHNLRAIRLARGLSMAAVAEAMGTTQQTIQRYETDPTRLKVHHLMQLAEILDCEPADFVEHDWQGSLAARAIAAKLQNMSAEDRDRIATIVDALAKSHANDAA